MTLKKLLTTALCLLMVLALPFSAMAAKEYTLTVTPGDDLASVEAVKDLLDVLSLRLLCGEQSSMLTIALSDTDAISLALRGDETGVFVQSAALGEKPLYFSKEDIISFMNNAIKSTSADGAAVSVSLTQTMEQAFTVFGQVGDAAAAATPEEAAQKMADVFKDDPAMLAYVQGVMDGATVTDGDFTAETHDPATQKKEYTITKDDLMKLADSTTVQKIMISSSKQDDSASAMTPEQAAEEYKKALDKMEFSIPMTLYTADEGKTLISMSVPMTLKGTAEQTKTEDGKTTTETKTIDVLMDMAYDRLTTDGVIGHNAGFTMTVDGKDAMKGSFALTDDTKGQYNVDALLTPIDDDGKEKDAMGVKGALTTSETASNGWLGMLLGGVQITFEYTGAKTADGKDKTIAIYERGEATSIVELSASDRPMVTLNESVNENAPEEGLADVNAATVEGSMQLLQMSQEELETALGDIMTSAQSTLLTVMGLLPPSVLQLLTGTDASQTPAA